MDSTWPFNNVCTGLPTHPSDYFDKLIIPEIFYNAVIERNINMVNKIIKYNPRLCINICTFYDITLKTSFFMQKSAKFNIPFKFRWKIKTNNNNIIMNFSEQVNLYSYITTAPWKSTNMGFLINAINNYLVQLRYVMGLINNKMPVNNYYNLGVNVHSSAEMKYYIAHFIPGYRWGKL